MVTNEGSLSSGTSLETEETPDFTIDDLTLLKEIFLSLEKAVDNIQLAQGSETKHGGYIFSILEQANVGLPELTASSHEHNLLTLRFQFRSVFFIKILDKYRKRRCNHQITRYINTIFGHSGRSQPFRVSAWCWLTAYARIFNHRVCWLIR